MLGKITFGKLRKHYKNKKIKIKAKLKAIKKSNPENLKALFYKITKRELRLENPQTFNEKIQWLKLYDSTPLKTRLTDKYAVRSWIKEKIGEKYLIPLLGVYNSFDEIDFNKLPNQFVIKCNHGSGWNIIVKDKSNFNAKEAQKKINQWMSENYAFKFGCELQYFNIKPKILIEKYFTNDNQNLYDYKFWCFNGKVLYMQFRNDYTSDLKMCFYDLNWKKQPFYYDHELYDAELMKPKNFHEMVKIASQLCKDFPFVCVDLYHLNDGSVKFGEMTFTRSSGFAHWNDDKYNIFLGSLITLPQKLYDIYTDKYYKIKTR